jgi:hypothetical protein
VWHDCRVLDLSVVGAGLEIYEPASDDLVGCEVSVQLQTASVLTGTLKNSSLVGVIRDVSSESERATRLGVQFVGDLSWSERALLEAYERMRLSW